MVNDDSIKIVYNNGKIITFKELFERDKQTRIEQAKLPFEEKIRILVAFAGLSKLQRSLADMMFYDCLCQSYGG